MTDRPSRHSRGELRSDRATGIEAPRQRARRKLRRVKTMIAVSRAFSDAGRRRRERDADVPVNLLAAPRVDEDAEGRIVAAAQARLHAHRGPRVRHGSFARVGPPRLFAAPDDIRRETLVTQHLVLGCREDAMDLRRLQALGVTHVLNTCRQLPNYHPESFVYHKIPLLDAPEAPIVTCCEVASNFLQRVERVGGRCLVHCIAGSSRSVTLAIMHLMISHKVPLHVAFHHISRMRPQANPNEGFKLQLALLELKLLGGSSVAGKDAGDAWFFYEWNVRKSSVPQLKERYGKGSAGESAACLLS